MAKKLMKVVGTSTATKIICNRNCAAIRFISMQLEFISQRIMGETRQFLIKDICNMNRKVDANLPEGTLSGPATLFPAPRILRLKEVCRIVGIGRSFVYRLQTENRFPHSIKIGARAVGWLEDEVRDGWQRE